ncbi:MAG: hypothetical protein NZM37_05595 [Sandaracinaceae bacterium]|nr:hypothetical protein [Sandaracinaceae bacterium]MDW8246968.1 hypothetical protein [Sandaracinaceae bacterium]
MAISTPWQWLLVVLYLIGCQTVPPLQTLRIGRGSPELAQARFDPESNSWESAPWGTQGGGVKWLPYPARTELEIEHGLDRLPASVLVYISFREDGTSCALAAGDLAIFLHADEKTIRIANATNQSYFARIVLR